MSIRVNEKVYGELEVVLGDREGRIAIQPWLASPGKRRESRVAVSLGDLKKDGNPKEGKGHDYALDIFDRADFVEALLAVFPELQRVSK